MESHWDDQGLGQIYRRKQTHLIQPGETKAVWGRHFSLPLTEKWDYRGERGRFFLEVHSERARKNGQRL